ncbi:hypothetical protein A3759_07100 [Thalassolituus sp. HI0120]|nr:hypothetical protein A3759_07100 [Thalassolituus sp. HI0120]
MLVSVILAGGSGSRLWPLSHEGYPKQFLSLGGESSMLQQTLGRVNNLAYGVSIVVCNDEHRFIVAEQLRGNTNATILIEPEGRNTAPSIALAAFQLLKQHPEKAPVMLVLPADHKLDDVAVFEASVRATLPAVEAGKFGTLGVSPDSPHTGYGYIKTGEAISESVFVADRFVEKPNSELAQYYIDQGSTSASGEGSWLWNSGIFLIRADRYLEELKRCQASMYEACKQAVELQKTDLDFIRIDAAAFAQCPDNSIDYALMESLATQGQVVVSRLESGWSDIGSWSSLAEQYDADASNNVVIGNKSGLQTVFEDSRNTIVCGNERLVATLGIDNLIIADTAEALLVARRDQDQNIKHLVEKLEHGRREGAANQGVMQQKISHRPWGYYDVVTYGDGYKVKKICVNAGASLSLQRHQYRAEHWVVVSGYAQVTRGSQTYTVKQNESTYISPMEIHKLENTGSEPLVIIEVQTGSYLEEDDIERLEDRYGREGR